MSIAPKFSLEAIRMNWVNIWPQRQQATLQRVAHIFSFAALRVFRARDFDIL